MNTAANTDTEGRKIVGELHFQGSNRTGYTRTTARKVTRGSKTLVAITFPDGVTVELGGKRAERATAAIICKLSKLGQGKRDSAWGQIGVRATLASAESECRTILNRAAKYEAHGYESHYDEIFAITID